ncbi:hypothetical protein NQ318_018967, partial [Aromia moschata]
LAAQAAVSGGVVSPPARRDVDAVAVVPQGYLPGRALPEVLRCRCAKAVKRERNVRECEQRLHGRYIHHVPLRATEGKEKVKVVGGEGTKELIVPSREPVDVPAILPSAEYERLKRQAHVLTLKDRMAIIEEAEKKKNQLALESLRRKELLTKAKQEQRAAPGSKLDAIESDAANKNLYLLKRSHELILEQDDRVKRANGVILATKCRAIRNAQIAEKKLIGKQLQEENKRLDMMMEQQRQKLIEIEEKKEGEEQEENKYEKRGCTMILLHPVGIHFCRYVTEVRQQIKENELTRLLEAERVEEESRMMNKALVALQKEEEQKQREKAEQQLKMREEFKKSNAEAEHYKNVKLEEQRISDMRIQQFMKEKAEREEARERELALAAAAKEKEIARLRAAQEKSADYQAAMDEMNALRTQEEKEREWREKEKAEAKKKKELLDDLRTARAKQIDDIRRAQAVSLARDEEAFLKVARVQRELFEKDVEEKKKKKELVAKHQRELLLQINEKERQRINERREKFEDGKAQRLEVEINDRQIENYLKDKVGGLRY